MLLTKLGSFSYPSDNIYYFREGKEGSSTAAYGEALYMATCLRMHNEESYEGLDYIEREVRRRAFWLLFGGSSTIWVSLGTWS